MVSENNRDKKENTNDLISKIDKLKQEWLQKKISLIELGEYVETLVNELKNEEDYCKVKGYVQNVIILDKNVENSNSWISNISLTFVTVMLTINSLILAQSEIKILSYICLGMALLFMIGIIVIFGFTMKKHMGNYAREKSFYEILYKYMD